MRLLRPPAQDPQVVFAEGQFVYCESSPHGIFLRRSQTLQGLARAPRRRIWAPPARGPYARNIWAPELHAIGDKWYVYFAADDGRNENHRMWVLVSDGTNPLGPYRLAGQLDTGGWAIDGTVFRGPGEQLFFLWSGWPGTTDGQQNLYLSRMDTPTRLAGERVLLATPDCAWERRGMPICEGPQVLSRGGRLFVVYSASASWTSDYCLGLLAHDGGDLLDRASWRKVGRAFGGNEHAWGVGHCGFVTDGDGADWILYHAKTRRRPGWEDREVRAQRFFWTRTGEPAFGEPRVLRAPVSQGLQRSAAVA